MLRGKGVALKTNGVPDKSDNAQTVEIGLRKTKADQRAFGACRTQYRAPGDVCVMDALEKLS